MKKTVYLGLGSNVGDREENLNQALRCLEQAGVHVVKASSLYETAPMYETAQDTFLNMAVEAQTDAMPRTLLRVVKGIETGIGRKPGPRNGPRLLDIDILLYSRFVVDAPGLQIPHPRLRERRFVLEPLLEIAPRLRHPLTGQSLAECLHLLPPQGVKKR
ncbi:MAG: 2-amino-4-hydroxy-6-hydroxymethyldihydropteridine diphosphokinase [Bryobacterales bacterium]|nr:2-amino-4-hydroxy-6-hydroxymethyldihydropteridine diphosphokinase [Bryobacterales bacterium]